MEVDDEPFLDVEDETLLEAENEEPFLNVEDEGLLEADEEPFLNVEDEGLLEADEELFLDVKDETLLEADEEPLFLYFEDDEGFLDDALYRLLPEDEDFFENNANRGIAREIFIRERKTISQYNKRR